MIHVQICCRILFNRCVKKLSGSFGEVFLPEHSEVSALQDSGYRDFHQAKSQQVVSALRPRIVWTSTKPETPRRPCSEDTASPLQHVAPWCKSCGIVPAVCYFLPPVQTAEGCCFVRMTQAD